MFLLFSHKLTPLQIKDAEDFLQVEEFIYLPKELQNSWSQIPPDKDDISSFIKPIKGFLSQNAKSGDFVLIQGDFGATYEMVNFCKKQNFIPIYSTNKRVAKEITKDNKIVKISEFLHSMYRKY